ncbi:DUF4145 domain-containing protein [Actinomadura opuntiae]|uniref:DUF4145 domain-containing protein n=1 Tax=Actinomadura sp. OS1-43 TaxID=604315 RepID=UPI00255B33BF|nr:DUF4145 domain-containing protein [Actinomadura sp. OS1-43]MDL4815311.1 DUF4145 domain-containing protein [Actinomadura sp. OS1-43]
MRVYQNDLDDLACPSCGERGGMTPEAVAGEFDSEGLVIAICEASNSDLASKRAHCSQRVVLSGSPGHFRRLWPPARSSDADPAIPAPLAASLAEARLCHDVGAHTAASIMVRRTLEGLCADRGIGDVTGKGGHKSLHVKLHDLHTAGAITAELLDWALHLKEVGNDAAHDIAVFATREDAEDAIALAEDMLRHLYVAPARYARAKARRERDRQIKQMPEVDVHYTVDVQEDGTTTLEAKRPQGVGFQLPPEETLAVIWGSSFEMSELHQQLERTVTAKLLDNSLRLGKFIQVDARTGAPVSST